MDWWSDGTIISIADGCRSETSWCNCGKGTQGAGQAAGAGRQVSVGGIQAASMVKGEKKVLAFLVLPMAVLKVVLECCWNWWWGSE